MDSKWDKIEEVAILDKNQPVVKAISFLQEGYDLVVIVDASSKYEGIIRTHDVVGKGINLSALCKTYENRNVPTIVEGEIEDPETVGEMLIIGKTRYLPVLDKFSKVKGAIKDLNVLSELTSGLNKEDFPFKSKEATNWDLVTIRDHDSVGNAIAKIREYGISRIPILDSFGELEGLVVNRSLLRTNVERRATLGDISGTREKDWHLLPVKDFITPTEITSSNTPLLEVINILINSNLHSLIVKEGNKYGIITPLDIIEFFLKQRKTSGFNVIVLQAPDDDIRNHAIRKGLSIMQREQGWLGANCNMNIRFKRNLSQSKRGQFSVSASVRLTSEKGLMYHTESTKFGAEKTINEALDNLSRIISDAKKKKLGQRDTSPSRRKISELEWLNET